MAPGVMDDETVQTTYMNCFDVDTGELRWQQTIDGGFRNNLVHPPTVIGGLVVAASGHHYAIFQASDGERLWRNDELAPGTMTPACNHDTFVVRDLVSAHVFEWEESLEESISRLPGQWNGVPPVLDDQYVLVSEMAHVARETNPGSVKLYHADGTSLGDLGMLSDMVSAPTVDGEGTGYVAGAAWRTDDEDDDVRDAFIRSFDLTDKTTIWETRYPDSEYQHGIPGIRRAPYVSYRHPVLGEDSLFVGFAHEDPQRPVIHCLDVQEGDERWSYQFSGIVGEMVVIEDVLLVQSIDILPRTFGRLIALR